MRGGRGVCVDARHLNLLPRPRHIDQVVPQHNLLAARQPAGGHGAGALLQRQLLVVPEQRLLAVCAQRLAVAQRAEVHLHRPRRVDLEGAQRAAAGEAVDVRLVQLREDARAPRDDATDADQRVQVRLPDVPDRVADGQVADAHEHRGVDGCVGGVALGNLQPGALVEERQDLRGRVRHPDGQDGLELGQVQVGHFQALSVVWCELG